MVKRKILISVRAKVTFRKSIPYFIFSGFLAFITGFGLWNWNSFATYNIRMTSPSYIVVVGIFAISIGSIAAFILNVMFGEYSDSW